MEELKTFIILKLKIKKIIKLSLEYLFFKYFKLMYDTIEHILPLKVLLKAQTYVIL